jgi:uncharacterized membrane protein
MNTYLKLFCIALPISLALDASWIGVIASGFYASNFGTFFRPDPQLWAAGLFYVLYAFAIIFFVLDKAVKEHSLGKAVVGGALLGFTAYMTYDLTNIATLAGWPIFGALVDTLWGTLMTAVTAGLTYLFATKVFKM